jgi:putative membrane protein
MPESKTESEVKLTWLKAWNNAPGPKSTRETLTLFGKGLAMGTADIIPGVSGGTIAFITGIYQNLLSAISSINFSSIWLGFQGKFKEALIEIHLKFLFVLFGGVFVAVLSTAHLMHFLLANYPVEIWSLFFGLILASIWYVGRAIPRWNVPALLTTTASGLFAYQVVGLIPIQTPNSPQFLFFCGLIAICAMILPGLSGSFLLLILGKYQFITGALRSPFEDGHLDALLVFMSGCLIGILGFSRILKFCLQHFEQITMCLLFGLMIGAMRKVWPWKVVIESELINGKEYVVREENILPLLDVSLVVPLVMFLLGMSAVIILEQTARQR